MYYMLFRGNPRERHPHRVGHTVSNSCGCIPPRTKWLESLRKLSPYGWHLGEWPLVTTTLLSFLFPCATISGSRRLKRGSLLPIPTLASIPSFQKFLQRHFPHFCEFVFTKIYQVHYSKSILHMSVHLLVW